MLISPRRARELPPSEGFEIVPALAGAKVLYRRLLLAGLSPAEAATLAGRAHGLRAVHGGWAIREVEHLLFVRAMVEAPRLRS